MIIINIGAHLGGFTDKCLELYPDVKKIYCFEPLKENYEFLLKKYIEDNRIEVINNAISNKNGVANLYKKYCRGGGCGSAGSSLKKTKINVSNDFDKVCVIKISSFINENSFKKIDILKIDAEGSEYDIFEDIFENDIHKITDKFYYEDHCRKIKGLSEKRDYFMRRVKELGIIDKIYTEKGHDYYSLYVEEK